MDEVRTFLTKKSEFRILKINRSGGQKGRGLGEGILPALAPIPIFSHVAEFRISLCKMPARKFV